MADKRKPLVNNFIYHIYNRGVAKNDTFIIPGDYEKAIKLIDYYRFSNTPFKYSLLKNLPDSEQIAILNNLKKQNKLRAKILSFTLMPNHFHFTLKQMINNGISKFVADFSNSYTRFINVKNDRVGPLFQGKFKSILIKTDEQLIHLSRYHHLNVYTDGLVYDIDGIINYPYSSIQNYLGNKIYDFVDTHDILSLFKNHQSYKKFVLSNRHHQRELSKIRHLLLENS